MDLKKQLPRIGIEKEDGFFQYGDHENSRIVNERPDYEEFKTGVYKPEPDCVAVLIGWRFVSGIYEIITDREDARKKALPDFGFFDDQEYRDNSNLIGLLLEIRQMINDGLLEGVIRGNQPAESQENVSYSENDEENHDIFYSMRRLHFVDFLAWAEKNGYPIPAELKEQENGQGIIQVMKNTAWDQISFRIVSEHRIEIKTPGNGLTPYNSEELGFAGKPVLWGLFDQFAKANGYLRPNTTGKSVKSNVSNLRKHLKDLFPDVQGEPIEPYNKRLGYVCNFTISAVNK